MHIPCAFNNATELYICATLAEGFRHRLQPLQNVIDVCISHNSHILHRLLQRQEILAIAYQSQTLAHDLQRSILGSLGVEIHRIIFVIILEKTQLFLHVQNTAASIVNSGFGDHALVHSFHHCIDGIQTNTQQHIVTGIDQLRKQPLSGKEAHKGRHLHVISDDNAIKAHLLFQELGNQSVRECAGQVVIIDLPVIHSREAGAGRHHRVCSIVDGFLEHRPLGFLPFLIAATHQGGYHVGIPVFIAILAGEMFCTGCNTGALNATNKGRAVLGCNIHPVTEATHHTGRAVADQVHHRVPDPVQTGLFMLHADAVTQFVGQLFIVSSTHCQTHGRRRQIGIAVIAAHIIGRQQRILGGLLRPIKQFPVGCRCIVEILVVKIIHAIDVNVAVQPNTAKLAFFHQTSCFFLAADGCIVGFRLHDNVRKPHDHHLCNFLPEGQIS